MTARSLPRFSLLLLVLSLLAPLNAWAIDLESAKSQGLVGEQADGYLGFVNPTPSAEVRALVTDVNGKRKAQYQRIAAKNSIALADVETLAGQKTLEKTEPGRFIKATGGGWQKK